MKHFQKGHMSGYFRSRKIGKLEQNVSKMLTGCQIFGIPQRSVSGKVCEIASRALSLQNMSGFLHVLAGWISKMDFYDGFCHLWSETSQRGSSLSSSRSEQICKICINCYHQHQMHAIPVTTTRTMK